MKPQALIQVEGFGRAVWDGRCRMSSGADDPPGAIKGSGVPHCRWHVLGRAAPGGITLPKAPGTGDKAWGHPGGMLEACDSRNLLLLSLTHPRYAYEHGHDLRAHQGLSCVTHPLSQLEKGLNPGSSGCLREAAPAA